MNEGTPWHSMKAEDFRDFTVQLQHRKIPNSRFVAFI